MTTTIIAPFHGTHDHGNCLDEALRVAEENFWTFEAFYNIKINTWLHLTPSIQYAQNQNKNDDPAVIPGVRLVTDF